MPTIGDYLFGNYAQVRAGEIRDEQASNLAAKVGQQAIAPIADQGIGPRRAQAATGIFELPPEQRAVEQARLTAASPGFGTQGVGLLNQALSRRSEQIETESRFLRDQQRQSSQFTTTDKRAESEFIQSHALKVVERDERAQAHLSKMLLADQTFEFAENSEARAVEQAERLQATFERIPDAEMQNIIDGTNNLEQMRDNITGYQKGFAWNDLTDTGAWIDRNALIRKKNKTQFDMEKLEFWRDIDSYQTFLLKEISGGAVTPEEYDRLTKLLPTAQMSDIEVDRNMRTLHREMNKRLQLRARAAVFQGQKDPTQLFTGGGTLPDPQFGEFGGAALTEGVELPEGARVIN